MGFVTGIVQQAFKEGGGDSEVFDGNADMPGFLHRAKNR